MPFKKKKKKKLFVTDLYCESKLMGSVVSLYTAQQRNCGTRLRGMQPGWTKSPML